MPTFPFVVALTALLALLGPMHAAHAAPEEAAPAQREPLRPWPPEPSESGMSADNPRQGGGDFGAPTLLPPSRADDDAGRPTVYQRAPNVGEDADDDAAGGVEWRIEDRRAKHKVSDLTLSLGIWPASVGGAVWAAIPVAPRGFIPSVNDAFFIDFGVLLMGSSLWGNAVNVNQFDILPALGVRWDFYLSRLVTLFGGLKLGPRLGITPSHRAFPDPVVSFGTILNVSKRALFRAELSYPQGFTFGLVLPLGHVE